MRPFCELTVRGTEKTEWTVSYNIKFANKNYILVFQFILQLGHKLALEKTHTKRNGTVAILICLKGFKMKNWKKAVYIHYFP